MSVFIDEALATLSSAIMTGIESRLKDLHTSMPGIIESFNATTQTATVQPAIKRIFKTREENEEILTPSSIPPILNVPVQFPRAGGFCMTFPVKKGDECLLVFCERSIDYWHRSGGVKNPGGKRFHHLSDAVAIVSISSVPNAIANFATDGVEIKREGGAGSIKILNDGQVEINSNANINLTASSNVNIDASNINLTASSNVDITATNFNVTGISVFNGAVTVNGAATLAGGAAITGTPTADGTALAKIDHTHNQANDSAGNTEQPTGPGIPQ